MVLLSYDILALSQREGTGDRTIGSLLFDFGRPLPDLAVTKTLQQMLRALSGLGTLWAGAEEVIDEIFQRFIQTLPSKISALLSKDT